MMKRKRIAAGLIVMMVLVLFSGCSGGSGKQELNPAFNEDTLKQAAEKVLDQWNQQDFEAMTGEAAENVKDKMTVEGFSEAWDKYMPKLGAFVKITQKEVGPNNDYALVIVVAEYANGKAQYTIGFDQEMKLNNFFIK